MSKENDQYNASSRREEEDGMQVSAMTARAELPRGVAGTGRQRVLVYVAADPRAVQP